MWNADLPDNKDTYTPVDVFLLCNYTDNSPYAKYKVGDYVKLPEELASNPNFAEYAGKSYWVVGLSVIDVGCVEYALSEVPYLVWEEQLQ